MRVFDTITLGVAWLAAALFAMTGAMLTWEVAARYFFIAPTVWAAEVSQLCLIWGSLIAMAWALRTRRHIAVDAVAALLPPGVRRITDTGAMLAVAAFSAVVFWHGFAIFHDSFVRGRTTGSMLDLPSWVMELSVPVGFGFLFVQALIEAVRTARGEAAAATAHDGH